MDLTVTLQAGKLNIRVAAWITHNDRVLAVTFPSGDQSLPGGRVQFGETTEQAIRREMKEETGLDFTHPTLFAVIENFFQHEGHVFHEFLYIYTGEFENEEVISTNVVEQTYHWVDQDELVQLKPPVLQQLPALNKSKTIHHLLSNQLNS